MNTEYMKEALRLAKISFDEGEIPVGAVIVKDKKIIGRGRNRCEQKKNPLCHAETEAIEDACSHLSSWRLSNCEMYVTMEPCPMCAGAISNAQIEKVYFGAFDEKYGGCGSACDVFITEGAYKTKCEGSMLEDECKALLYEFFNKIRKKTNDD